MPENPGFTDQQVGHEVYGFQANARSIPDVVRQLREKGVPDEQLKRCLEPDERVLLESDGEQRWINQNLYPDKLICLYGEPFARYVLALQDFQSKWGNDKPDKLAEYLATNPVPPVEKPKTEAVAA